jgi:hypothetical protein
MKRTIATSRSNDDPTNPIQKKRPTTTLQKSTVSKEGDNAYRYPYALILMQNLLA